MTRAATSFDKETLSKLFAEKRFSDALRYVETLKLAGNDSISQTELADIYYVSAQCFYRLGNYRRAAVKLRCSIKIANPLNDNLFYARQKYTLGQIYRQMGRIDDALNEYTESYAFFKRVGDHTRMLAAVEAIAVAHFEKGNFQQAIQLCEETLVRAKALHVQESYTMTAFNLCRILLLTGDFQRVRDLLGSLSKNYPDPLNQVWLESLHGMLHVRLCEAVIAEDHLNAALSKAKEMGYRREEVVCLEYLGLNAFYEGDCQKAIDIYTDILGQSELTASAIAQTLWQLTEAYTANGDLKAAAETAPKAKQALTRVKEWAELGCLHRALALLADKRGDAKSARDHFGKSIEILARHGACYELALTHFAAGQSTVHSSASRLDHLHQAKALFVEMDVPKRVEQVEVAFTRLTGAKAPRKSVRSDKIRIEDPDIITQNPAMMRILSDAAKFAQTNMNILITGETGTGKDLLAKRIHCLSRRSGGPFRNENMSRFPRELVDSELFGYEKGSHSRAENGTPGLIELADGGTFCLNEVAELPLEMQVRLLQVIEEGTVRRVGGGVPRPVDVRFITMTNCDLEKRVEARLFRHDLLFRLRGGHLHIPPLRERMDDLALLVQYFLKQMEFADYTPEQAALIVQKSGCDRYHWPGNVRDLLNVLERAVTLAPSSNVMGLLNTLSDVMERLPGSVSEVADKEELVAALNRCGGNQTRAAEDLGVSRTTLRYRMQRHGLL